MMRSGNRFGSRCDVNSCSWPLVSGDDTLGRRHDHRVKCGPERPESPRFPRQCREQRSCSTQSFPRPFCMIVDKSHRLTAGFSHNPWVTCAYSPYSLMSIILHHSEFPAPRDLQEHRRQCGRQCSLWRRLSVRVVDGQLPSRWQNLKISGHGLQ